jgi:hypothetical protein
VHVQDGWPAAADPASTLGSWNMLARTLLQCIWFWGRNHAAQQGRNVGSSTQNTFHIQHQTLQIEESARRINGTREAGGAPGRRVTTGRQLASQARLT